ncbi:MAG: glycosyltransferase family 87 protein [Candidatus Limnocylindrales bacterium]
MTVSRIGDTMRREVTLGQRLMRDRRRLAAVLILGVSGGLVATFLIVRGERAGSDARAYWAAVRIWFGAGDEYHPPAPFLPWVYAPWTLGLFVPWALLPWSVAWFLLRGVDLLLLIWTAHWAYQRRPLATAITLAVLAAPIAATFDTGNITFLLAMMIWATQFVGHRLAGVLWAVATSIKWFPAFFIFMLPPRARLWGIAALSSTGILLLATWPQTIDHFDLAFNYPRPIRLDLLLLGWGAVPWLWRKSAFWELDRAKVRAAIAAGRNRLRDRWSAIRHSETPATDVRRLLSSRIRTFFGVG